MIRTRLGTAGRSMRMRYMAGGVSAKYAIQFGLMSLAAAVAAVFGVTGLVAQVVLIWVAIALAVVAIAYALGRPRLLMKRDDGSQPVVAWIVLGPYFLLARFSLLLYRLSNRGKVAVAEVLPGIWFARRLTGREMRRSGVTWSSVLDLAAEFPRVPSNGVAYRDATARWRGCHQKFRCVKPSLGSTNGPRPATCSCTARWVTGVPGQSSWHGYSCTGTFPTRRQA